MRKKLLIYYSYTGHTRIIAKKIEEAIDCDIVEIKPKNAYTKDYQYVVDNTENPTREEFIMPEIEPIDIEISNYNVIIVGTPVWWYQMAAPIRSFLSKNNLSGKIIIPFATNAGWLGHTFKEFADICTNSKVENELSIKFSTDYNENKLITSEEEIDKWIKQIKAK